MKNNRTELSQRVRYALLAGMAGAFLIPQVAFAAPTGENVVSGGAAISRSGNDTNISSSNTNNVIEWRDYSLASGERVVHDGGAKTHNYLNIVTGANTSNINGKIEGGKDVYIVNPNGVIFGKSAEVNVGNLYVSTQEKSTLNQTAFTGSGASPLVNTAALKADVVNMGKITADTVEVHGSHIRFLNAADVHTTANAPAPVKVYTDTPAASLAIADGGYAHIGYRGTAPTNYTAGNTSSAAPEYYQLVANQAELSAINSAANLSGKYMLENDIDFASASHTPIGTTADPFTGKFDGNFFQIKNFKAADPYRAGLFGEITNARIENLGVTGAEITGGHPDTNYAGGIAAYAMGSLIKNVYVKGSEITSKKSDGSTGAGVVGGIIGAISSNTTIDSAYAKNRLGGNAGGIVGRTAVGATGMRISNAYNDSVSIVAPGTQTTFIYQVSQTLSPVLSIENSYNVGFNFSSNKTNLTGALSHVYELDTATKLMRVVEPVTTPTTPTRFASTAAASYSGWSINNTGEPGAKWRIYEGRTLPLLTAFMGVSSEATYNYRYFKSDGTHKDDSANVATPNGGKDLSKEYNSYYLKIVDKNSPDAIGGKSNVTFGAGADASGIKDYVSGHDLDTTNGIRNAGTKAILWTEQDGPNLRGVNVEITPRDVRIDSGNINPKRMYNGKSDVTQAFIKALTNGSVQSSGFTQEDIDAGSVHLDFNVSGNTFKAWTVDSTNNPDKNVGTNKNVKFSGTIGFTGPDAGNYTFDGTSLSNLTGKATITKAPLYLNIAKNEAAPKVYDGTTTVVDTDMLQSKPNITLKDDVAGLTLAQINAGTAMPDGAIMTGDDDVTPDNVGLATLGGPKYTDEHGVEQIHVGNHKLQYTGAALTGADAGNYELYYTPKSGTKTQVRGGNVYLDGEIIPRQILTNDFKVYDKTTHNEVDAKKVYNGDEYYDVDPNRRYLSSKAPASGTTGLVTRDQGHISFTLSGNKGKFIDNDTSRQATKNVSEATRVAYEVQGKADNHTDTYGGHLLTDYYVMVGGVKKSLGDVFDVTSAGKITPKALTATVVNQHITKVYDAMREQTDGNRNITRGDGLVTLSGWVAGDTARTNTSTAKYATKDVVLSGGNPTTQSVTYYASFTPGSGAEAQNYTLGTEGVTPISTTKTLTGTYTGTITPRPVKVKFADVTKIYDGTVTNTQITASDLDDGLNKDVLNADSIGVGSLSTAGVTSRYGDNKTVATFAENRNAGSRSVEYAGLTNSLGTNYKLDAKQYGDGTITRRRIDPTGFKVRKSDGTLADATKVYDGKDTYNLPSGAYLTGSSASGNTGIVSRDFGKVVFELKTNAPGHFTSDAAGANRTSHVSEAQHIAYDIKAKTLNPTDNPLSNYTFGAAGSPRNLETVTDANPAQVTAGGSITPASLRANTQQIEKVYDGLTAHTDGNQNVVKGDTVVNFTGWAVHGGTTEKRTNDSTAVYATKDVAYAGSGVTTKSVTYTGKLTGMYADDYQIVDAGNNVISTKSGSGAATTVTMNVPITVANAGKITPRKLKVKMGDVTKTYDGTAGNTSATVTGFTDDPASTVLATILGGDNVTATRLTNRYQGMVSPANTTTTSTYGRGDTDATFGENANASNGTQHDVQYTNLRNAFKNEFGATTAGNYTVDDTAYGKGTINRRDISPSNFQVIDLNGHAANATKVYDGTSDYKVPTGWRLTPPAGPGTGVIAADQNDVFFRLSNQGAQFADNSDNPTANVANATKVLYNVVAAGDATKIKNYTLNGVALESGAGKVSGGGSITRRVLELGLVQDSGIDKVYDGTTTLKNTATKNWNVLRDSDSTGNVKYADGSTDKNKLVTSDGTSFNITSNYMESGSADKNVKRSGGNIVDKDILYKVAINGDATNYSFKKGGSVTDAENGLTLSATGKITPKDLSGAFKKVTKVYDGTKNVPASDIGFTTGAVVSSDTVNLGVGSAQYQSENVNGDGTKWTPPGGTPQKNWVNYSGLTLGGTDAGNYKLSSTARGLGEITPLALNPSNITFNIGQATKEYDGLRTVKKDGSDAMTDVKNYIASATTTVNSTPVDVLPELSVTAATYDTKDVDGGRSANRVTYTLKYTGASGNFTIGSGTFTKQGNGVITKKDVTATVKSPVSKVYDATTTLTGVAKDSANAVVTNANDLIGMTGFTGNDGATYTTTAVYADKNAGTGKVVNYTLAIDAANAGNYNLKYNGTNNAGSFSTNDNTITKRKVDVSFADVTKTYDTTPTNTSITGTVSAADKAVLNTDSAGLVNGSNALTNLSTLNSQYGTGTGASFTANPNAGTNKDVRYQGLGAQMGATLGANAANYEFAADGYGKGTITRATINAGDVIFGTSQATKVYDGTRAVKHSENAAPSAVKNYITSAQWNGHNVLGAFDVDTAEYNTTANVNGGAPQNVTYKMKLNGSNTNFQLGTTNLTANGTGVITKKDVTATVKSPVSKVYDATKTVVGVAKNSANTVVANANDLIGMTGFTGNDGATYTATAQYADKNAGTGKQVDYTLTLNGAAAGNYNLKYNGANNAGAFSTNDNTITKRKVDVTFAPVSKTYDGTPTNTSITPSVSADDAAVLSRDNAARVSGTNLTGLTGITSQYGTGTTDATFAANPNAGTDKSVQYAGIGTAMGTAFGANNYEFATNGYGTGKINKANINTSDITFATTGAHKVYDGTKTVKYNGSSASNDVKNYITTATANLGGGHTADLRGDLVIDEAGTHYSSPNATNGTPDTVTYKFRLNNSNIEISGTNEFEMTDSGTIDRRVLNLDLRKKSGIDKIYDANAKLVDTNTRHYDKFTDDDALGNVTYAAGTTNDNKLVRTANGGAVDDGATMTIEANYVNNLMSRTPDKHVARDGSGSVTTKDIAYKVSIDAAKGGQNYKLSDGVTTVNAETGLNTLSAQGTISPRALTFTFGDVSKPYDTTAVNNTKTINNVAAADSDGRGTATLAADGITAATFSSSTGGVTSLYGAGNTDATFHSDPNVVTDANGNVIERGKDVQYTNVGSVLSGANANNYTVADTAYGKGTIRKRTVSVNDFNFNISNATKEYDGTRDVEYVEGGKTYKDLPHLKKRFQTSTLDLGGGNTVPINLDDITLTGAKYNDERVAHATGINYDVTINAQNFEFNGGRDKRIKHTGDTITKRDLATKLPPHLVKEYDGEDSFTETNTVFANAMARANLTGVVDSDKNKIRLAVNGHYDSPDASAETREEAEARTPAQAGRNVRYDLTLSGDTDTLSNYKIGTVETLDSDGKMRGVGSGKADIYKKTLTVGVDNIDKLYDGTRTVVRPNGTGTLPHPEAGKFRLSGFVGSESFSFDQTAADKIDGLYSDPNVSRRNGAVVDKDISYSGIKTAFANYAGHDPTGYAKNYRVDSDTLSGKGKILPRPITANEITNGLTFDQATKVYDGTTKVKYNGENTPDALKNYLTSATVNVDGTPIDIRNDLTIRADEAYTHYDTQHVAGGAQPRVTYTLNYTGDNFDISGDLTKTANGVITKRKVTAFAPGQLTKVYDASEKVYDPHDTSIKTYRRGTRVTDGDSIVRMSTEDGDTGLLANDGVRNISTATFDDKNVGKRKKVTYNVAVDSTHAGDYEIVDTLGNTISELTTRNNEITPRRLDLTFGNVDKFYDGTSTNEDMPATRVTDSDTRRTLGRDRARIFNDELIMQDAAGNDLTLPSDYGYGSTDRSFTPDANASQAGEPDKSVQYRNMGDALRTILGDNAKNYEFDETGYGKGRINKAKVSERDFRLNFKDAVREYDGTSNVDHAIDNLQDDSRWKSNKMLKSDIASVTGTYMSPNGSTPDKNAADRKIVDYKVRLNERNFDFGSWDGVVSAEGGGAITKRKIIAETPRYLTKEYDGTKDVVGKARDAEGNLVKQNGDGLITFRHYNETAANKYDAADGLVAADTAGNTVRNATTALYADKNVAWKDGAWKNGHGTVDDMNVNYSLTLSGTDAANYELVDADGKTVKNTTGNGKITPKDIHLKSDPQTRWINEGLPNSYTGTPSGSNYETGVNGEALPGEIYYDSPNGKLRWGDYAINGYYRASDKEQYQRPDGSRYQLADKDKTPDGDSVARNYRFVQDPANATALHIGPYVPDTDYYQALTQASKMIPDEYAYENASLDRRSHFGRDPEAEISYAPPSVNTIKDGVDITQTGIHVQDETVFTLMNEVFGGK